MYKSPKQKGVALKKWPLDANDVSFFKGYLKKITSEGGRRQKIISGYLILVKVFFCCVSFDSLEADLKLKLKGCLSK